MGGVLAEKLRQSDIDVTLVTPGTCLSAWTTHTDEQTRIQAQAIEQGVKLETSTALESFDAEKAIAVLACALRVADRIDEGNIVCLFADGGWKYLSTGVWTRPLDELAADMGRKIWW